jgi:16S rRNA (cytosine1402-N4)-methyltransferase
LPHVPVLSKEVLQYLDLKPGQNVVDGTVGQGGHARSFLDAISPDGRVLGIDLDAGQVANARAATAAYHDRIILVHGSYANLKEIAEREHFGPIQGIVLDLGYSSWQLEQSGKGFSFQKDEPLDMRYDLENPLTAEVVVNSYSKESLAGIIEAYGEDLFAKKIADQIVQERAVKKITSTFQLRDIVGRAAGIRRQKIHPATRTFQAIRIAVNGELDALKKVLPDALGMLAPGGRLAVISFHSLEDRIVKHFFQEQQKKQSLSILTPKPVIASPREVAENPRARSAKLRTAEKISLS